MQQESSQPTTVRKVLTPQELLSFVSPSAITKALKVLGGLSGEGEVAKFPKTGMVLLRSGGQWVLDGDARLVRMAERHLQALRAGKKLHGSEPMMEIEFN